MRIGIVTDCYPASPLDELAQRRMAVAVEIARRGHDVHILALGENTRIYCADSLWIHEFAKQGVNHYSPYAPELDVLLSRSQLLHEGLVQCSSDSPFDIVDLPLESLLGVVTLQKYRLPGVILTAQPFTPNPTLEQQLASKITHRYYPHDPVVLSYAGSGVNADADRALTLYEQVLKTPFSFPPKAQRVYQVMEALDYGDAVSNIARHNAALLAEMGQPSTILARYSHPSLQHATTPIRQALADPKCGLIFHYWGLNHSTWILSAVRGPKAVYYHNVTPSHYFSSDNELYYATAKARVQLSQIATCFDLVIADSQFNLDDFSQYLPGSKPSIVIYPVVDRAELQAAPYGRELSAALKQSRQTNILFVGRVARNKRQDRVMQAFDYYHRNINRQSHLWLVGNDQVDVNYRTELETLREQLPSGRSITITGKVNETALYAYYRSADIFLCASEHEGFCIPLVQAMAFDIPVLAYAVAAVPETVGRAGLLIHEWDTMKVAEVMQEMTSDTPSLRSTISKQHTNLLRFLPDEARKQWHSALNLLLSR